MSDLIKTYNNVGKWYEVSGSDELWEDVDFTDPNNFCRFGSAEEYYKKTVEYILESFPYDGSWKQKNEWYSSLFILDRYFYKNILPKSTGYAEFSANGWGARAAVIGNIGEPVNKEYIRFFGGPNNPDDNYTTSNIVKSSDLKGSNISFGENNTVEFFMKRGVADYANTTYQECILDIWNQVACTDVGYRRFTISVVTNVVLFVPSYVLRLSYNYGGASTVIQTTLTELADNLWHFYSISIEKINSTDLEVMFYIDTELRYTTIVTIATLETVEKNLIGWIGSFQSPVEFPLIGLSPGYGKLEASLDEFRFFKTVRSQEEIKTYYRSQIFGGTNDDSENEGLGVYYKFNEGVSGVAGYDATVLDYSGRKTNGYWYGYVGGRSEESAFEESGACDTEEPDLILNLLDSRIQTIYTTYINSGRYYDSTNRQSVKGSFPSSLVSVIDNDEFTQFCQIIGAFFDEMLLTQSNIPKNLIGKYEFTGMINNDINLKYLGSLGIKIEDLFGSADWKETLLGINSSNSNVGTVDNVKKIILSNITNEAVSLLKAKGTTEGLKKALRCFGIAEDIVQFKKYSPAEKIEDDKTISSNRFFRKRYADFSNPDNHDCVVSNIIGVPLVDDRHYLRIPIDGTFQEVNHCFYCDFIIPDDVPTSTTTSVCGMVQVNADDATAIGGTRDFYIDIKKFPTYGDFAGEIKAAIPGIAFDGNSLIDTPLNDLFNSERWVVTIQIFSEELQYSASGVPASDYTAKISFFRVQDSVCSKVYETSQAGFVPADIDTLFSTAKRFYLGAHRTNIIGALQLSSCCKVGDFRYYARYLTDDEIIRLAEEDGVLGLDNFIHEDNHTVNSLHDSLVLNWNFNNVQELEIDGAAFKTEYIADCADGSNVGNITTDIGVALSYRYPCIGYLIPSVVLGDFFSDEYLLGVSHEDTESNFEGDIQYNFKNYDLEKFYKNNVKGVETYSVEKSFAKIIDKGIFESFSDKNQYFDMFLDGVQRYKDDYDVLAYARQLYFRKIQNGYLDFDKFYNYYKWIDGAVSEFLSQFIHLKKHTNNRIIDTIEHHSLERTKIHYKREQDVLFERNSFESDPILSGNILGALVHINEQNTIIPYGISNRVLESAMHVGNLLNPFDETVDQQGNFINNYEVVNLNGRYENNKFQCVNFGFVKTTSIPNQSKPRVFFDREFSIFSPNYCYSGFISEASRHRTKSIIVNRFQAPGDIWTSSRRSDVESLEKSVYNNINFRNLSSRRNLTVQWMVG